MNTTGIRQEWTELLFKVKVKSKSIKIIESFEVLRNGLNKILVDLLAPKYTRFRKIKSQKV